jgi:hypothetical protein
MVAVLKERSMGGEHHLVVKENLVLGMVVHQVPEIQVFQMVALLVQGSQEFRIVVLLVQGNRACQMVKSLDLKKGNQEID